MIGNNILHYKILEKLGEGGMGVVYKAEDTELNRYVALKFLPSRITYSNTDLSRLKQEAQAAAVLNHPNICTVYAIEEDNGRKFISMEYMDGITLRKKIADAPLNINEAVLYAIQIVEALNEAHKHGIIHRDIKTENIMINSKNQVKVMDFGLAKLKGGVTEPRTESTFGTLAYMSPEQAIDTPPGFPADIWSFGIVCYEMFTGRLPFLQSYEAAIIYSILNEEPLPPSQIRPDITPDIENIILKCLMKKVEERYSSTDQIVTDFEKIKKDLESRTIYESLNKELAKEVKKATEQKQATIVYMKIQNYGDLMEEVGQENIVEILEHYYGIINMTVPKYGGTVNKTETSEAVLYFGLPETIENASHKAMNSVIEITEKFRFLCKDYKIPENFTLNISVSSGTVIAGSISSGKKLEYTVIGDAPETALKLLEAASGGQILVESITYKSLKNLFSFKQIKSVALRGKRDPVKVYEFEFGKKYSKNDLLSSKRIIESEMVGRSGELDKLEYLLLKTINGEGSIVNIIADAGIGKSRLIDEFKKKEIFQRVILLEGKAEYTDKNVSFHPIILIIKQWANINEKDNEGQAFTKLENAISNLFGPESGEIIPFIATLMGFKLSGEYATRVNEVSPDSLNKLIQKSMRLIIMKGSELKPVVILIEDLHWADLSSIELLQSLLRLADNNRLLFINTFRPNYAETGDKIISAIKGKYNEFYTEIRLSPLSMSDRQILIQNLLRMQHLPVQIEKTITKNTEGNPFFIEEVIRSLIDDNVIEVKNDQFIISQSIENIVIPTSVKDLLLARIDKLDETAKYILKVASVIGRYFLYDILKKVTEEIDNLDIRIDTLIRLELIKINTDVIKREYLFQHALAHEAVYETLLVKNRQELHFKVAAAIENLYPEKIGDFYELLAHHYSLANDKEKAEEYLIKAGERTLRNAASSEALKYFEEALKLYLQKYGNDVDKNKIYMLEKNIGTAFYNKGYFIDSVEHFRNALNAAGFKTNRSKLIETFHLAVNLFIVTLNLYLPVNRQKKIPTEKDNELFDILFKIANSYANFNGKKMFYELLNLVKLKNGFLLEGRDGFETYSLASSLFTYSGISFAFGKKFLEKANSYARLKGIDDVYNSGYDETIYKCLSGNWKNFTKINEKLLNVNLRTGELFKAIYHICWALYIFICRGDYEYAEYLISKGEEISETFDFDYGKLYILSFKADLNLSRRNLHKAINYYTESCEFAERLGLNSWIIGLSGKRAKAYILLNDFPSAKTSFDKAEKALNETDSLTPMLLSYYVAYKLLYFVNIDYRGNEKEIRKSIKTAVKISNKVAEIRPEVQRYIGNYYRRLNKFQVAAKYYKKSIKYAEHLECLPELGRSCMELGKFLSDKGIKTNDKEPGEYLTEAENIFSKLHLDWDLAELKRIKDTGTVKIK